MSVEFQGSGRARSWLVLTFICPDALRWQLHELQPHLTHSRMDQTNLPGYPIGYINFAAFLIGSPVINAYNFKGPIPGIHNAHPRTEGKVRVSGRQGLAIELLAIGGHFAIELRTVPTGIPDPNFDRLYRSTQMGYQGRLHRWTYKEHQRHPTERGPGEKEWSSHVCSFGYKLSKKLYQYSRIMSTIFDHKSFLYLTER